MATAYATIRQVEFIIEDEITHCNLFYTSTEPGTPWGGGWKTKSFPASKSVLDILKDEVGNYIFWNDGRENQRP